MLTNTLQNKIFSIQSRSSFLWKQGYRYMYVCMRLGNIQYRKIDPTHFRDVFHRTTL